MQRKYHQVALGKRGMVASAHPLASLAGLDALREGGNAMDACVTMAAVTSVVMPDMCGLGGDVFAIYWDARTRRAHALNASGIAPRGATLEFFLQRGYRKMPLDGMLSVAVPGAVAAFERALREFGTFSLGRAFRPAIELARDGFPVTPRLHRRIGEYQNKLAKFPATARIFLPGGRPPAIGELLVQKDLAQTMEMIVEGGSEAFYRGPFAQAFYRCSRESGGLFQGDELEEEVVEVYEPWSTTYRGYEVLQTGPVSQGLIMLEELNLLEGFDLAGYDPLHPLVVHLMVEAKKVAFGDRLARAGDPRFIKTDLRELISKEYAAKRQQIIDPQRAMDCQPGPETLGDTTYFCAVDGQGNACSFIHSISMAFGSGVVVPGTGVLLNNRAGRGFVLDAEHPNCIAPGKRTMHTLNCYMVLREGVPYLVGGTPGGDGQPQWNLQVLVSLLDFGLSVQEAVDLPRWLSFPGTDPAHIDNPLELRMEERFPPETLRVLTAKGHRVRKVAPWGCGGAAQLIMIDPDSGLLLGGSDRRAEGNALGY